jgi:hypothetical protein
MSIRCQYTLRSLLAFFVLVALMLGIVVSKYRRAIAIDMTVAAIEEAGTEKGTSLILAN